MLYDKAALFTKLAFFNSLSCKVPLVVYLQLLISNNSYVERNMDNRFFSLIIVPDSGNDVKSGSQKTVFSSGTKYLLFILLEVIIFHFAVRTLSILRGTKREISLNDFFKAEKRMIILMGINFIKGIVAYIVVTVALSIVGFNSYTPFVMFFVYAYFIGFGFLDNYNEQFGKTMNQSLVIVRQHVGASTAIGLLISGLLFIPFIGPLFSPIFGAIAATIYGERYKIELSPIIESS